MITGTYKECDKMAKQILKESIFQRHSNNYEIYDKVIIINANSLDMEENYKLRQLARDYGLNYWISDCSNNRILFPHSNKNNISHVTGRIAYIEDIEIKNTNEYISFKMDSYHSFEYSLHMISEWLEDKYDIEIKYNVKKSNFTIKIFK